MSNLSTPHQSGNMDSSQSTFTHLKRLKLHFENSDYTQYIQEDLQKVKTNVCTHELLLNLAEYNFQEIENSIQEMRFPFRRLRYFAYGVLETKVIHNSDKKMLKFLKSEIRKLEDFLPKMMLPILMRVRLWQIYNTELTQVSKQLNGDMADRLFDARADVLIFSEIPKLFTNKYNQDQEQLPCYDKFICVKCKEGNIYAVFSDKTVSEICNILVSRCFEAKTRKPAKFIRDILRKTPNI